ncbi:RelA/SpoT family protein [Desulforhabdus amnigena]|uniref:GTP pyrophosphokinase n=1 Tax=Desulforhabdus amnigena TaxID=40218 RepID=A0A9W6FUC2_9BACT|nr:bifunctional (p)ppGpp synthetase/guanosine-3',5'-bis(diphosphate) 3'-pyrophosphohydrolase [Desulforhabdus amnigena]NLJ27510.1 bifunctional (p)ppGpp synthetase/guanosine-3',5'-bis(diphosphate) 3'-pyrophosphohydrolase [Deltaproteobacteria bacterium]GLI35031.1 GTP pyrophosphokinase [Desulforhabdus amnigena]
MRFFEIVDRVLEYYPKADILLLEKAYVFAARVYHGRARLAGEPYLDHPLAVAGILAQMRLDEESIVSGLLHDAFEEGLIGLDEITEDFGAGVARIVEGVAKVTRLDFSSRKEQQAEYMRKMILALSPDVRVVLVKLADRLHDMRSFLHRCSKAQQNLARETLDIYSPLAARLGIDWIKLELENLAFKCLEPEEYREIFQGLAKTEEDRKRYIEEVKGILTAELEAHDLKGRVSGRSKHLYSIYLKMKRQNLDLQRVHDLIAFRIILDSVKSCYEALGLVHTLWEPVAGRFKDYIVKPKSNMYQSLHTTVIGPYGEKMEVQIRTEEMDRVANEGIAAHWMYKQRGNSEEKVAEHETQRFSWLRELLEWNQDWRDPRTLFLEEKAELYPDEVYVFTPRREVKSFPRGATPVDFAYDVHSEVGHRCVGARVNGKIVPLRYELQNGDTVEVLTAPNHHPSKDWLKFVKTSKALHRIRHWIKAEERERSVALGREICEREFRKKGLNFNNYINSPELLEVAKAFSLKSVNDLLASVGYHKISPIQMIGRLPSVLQEQEAEKEEAITFEKRKPAAHDDGIKVRGVDKVMIRMARCCNPLPGEPIVGYITRGRGITVHRASCKNLVRGDLERKIDVQWDSGGGKVYPVDIKVVYSGDKGMLATLNGILGSLDVKVLDLHIDSQGSDSNVCRFRIEVKDTQHLQRVLSVLRGEKGVYRVQRSME